MRGIGSDVWLSQEALQSASDSLCGVSVGNSKRDSFPDAKILKSNLLFEHGKLGTSRTAYSESIL